MKKGTRSSEKIFYPSRYTGSMGKLYAISLYSGPTIICVGATVVSILDQPWPTYKPVV